MNHLNTRQLELGLDHILGPPADNGELEMIVRHPETDQREVLSSGELDEVEGLVGGNWIMRGSGSTADGAAHPGMQLNLMNSRVIDLIAGERNRWSLAGDQLFVDMSLDPENLPPGTRISIGETEIEVTAVPHLGCSKFSKRFGRDAMVFVNDERGRSQNLRGINARVVRGGQITTGDRLIKI
jgi:hypothetical protein